MTELIAQDAASAFIVFCRVGVCLMILPGFSGGRIPPTVRLFVAIAIALAVLPAVGQSTAPAAKSDGLGLAVFIVTEVMIGLFLGFLVRIFYLALEFFAIAMANFAGYGSVFMQAIDDNSSTTAFSELVTLPSIALFFIMDLHVAVISMLQSSYTLVSVGRWIGSAIDTGILVNAFKNSFVLMLQMSAPLLVYSLTLNFVLGLLNKLIPQVPIYFVSAPFLIVGGLVLLMQTDGAILQAFSSSVGQWIGELGGSAQ